MNNTARTANGAVTLKTTNSACLDFFFLAGASRGKDISQEFIAALADNFDVAVRTLLWLRDVRGGAGERQTFRSLLKFLGLPEQESVMRRIPELGRWDDILVFAGTALESKAFAMIEDALRAENALCAKWMPRKDPKGVKNGVAVRLRKHMGMTPKQYRKTLVNLSMVVETAMCAKEWGSIDFSKLPSVASARYQKAFGRNAADNYAAFKESLVKGETKVNAGALYPYDLVLSCKCGDAEVSDAQWKALPDFLEGSDASILPVIDVSGSMSGYKLEGSSATVMDAAIGLGIYLAERSNGPFKNQYITFSEQPRLVTLDPSWDLLQKVQYTRREGVGYSTNFQAVFTEILIAAKRNNLKQADLPEMVLVLSDMEFNQAERSWSWNQETTNFEAVDRMFKDAGYERPKLVFWNLNGRPGNNPVSMGEAGTALVSGFSPSLMKSILNASDFNPEAVMLETVMVPRYDY